MCKFLRGAAWSDEIVFFFWKNYELWNLKNENFKVKYINEV